MQRTPCAIFCKIRRKQHEKTALSAIMSAFVDDGRGK